MRDLIVVWLLEFAAVALCAALWGSVTFAFALVGLCTALACTALAVSSSPEGAPKE